MFQKDNCHMEWELLGIILAGMVTFTCKFFKNPLVLPSPMHSNQGRETRFDILRGLAMIGIVMIHIHSYFQFFHPADSFIIKNTLLLSNLARFSVPIFILTSAIFLRKKDGYWNSKVKHLVLPYTLFSILGYWIKYEDHTLNEFFLFYILGKVFTPFYFVPLLLQFYLVFYILNSILINEKWNSLILAISFIINILSNLGIFDTILPIQYHSISIFNYIFFFILGVQIGNLKFAQSQNKGNSSFTLFVYFSVFLGLLIVFSHSYDMDLKNHHTIYPIFFLIFVWNFLDNINPSLSNILSYIGNQSLFIFLLHPFIIHFMHSIDPYTFGGPFLGYIVTLILNVVIPIFVAFIIQKGMFLYQSRHLT
ncbi:acyltransferase family protein [Leptospira sp. WS39.C2]